jgi:hypothetical protein
MTTKEKLFSQDNIDLQVPQNKCSITTDDRYRVKEIEHQNNIIQG